MLTIVESPYASDITVNTHYAKLACRDCIGHGEVPFASHLFFPQFLSEARERELGLELGYRFWGAAQKIVFYIDLGWSPGMQAAFARALELGKETEQRNLPEALMKQFDETRSWVFSFRDTLRSKGIEV